MQLRGSLLVMRRKNQYESLLPLNFDHANGVSGVDLLCSSRLSGLEHSGHGYLESQVSVGNEDLILTCPGMFA